MSLDPALAARLANRPLAHKLGLLLLLCGAVTALVSSLIVAALGWRAVTAAAQDEAAEVSTLLAHTLVAAVAFDDGKGMYEALNVLGARRDVLGAWVWHPSGRLMAERGAAPPVPANTQRGGLIDGVLETSRPVGDAAAPLAHVTLRLDLSKYRDSLLTQGLGLLLALALGAGLSIALAQRLARRLVEPIVRMADAAGAIAEGRDYEHRLPAAGHDEVGRAVAAFNAMIDEVQSRGDALERANRGLEERVAERTTQLEAEKARAEAASVAKTRFLANMSHELRTPLNGVIGAAQLLRDQGDDTLRRHELIAIIRASGGNLLGLVDSVLDLARIESGTLALSQQDFNLAESVDAVIASTAVAARQKGLRLSSEIDPALALWRHGDALRVRQVLLNLLGNAVKFTLHGEVELRVLPDDEAGGVRLVVRDTGIGMNAATLATAFEPFRQAEDGSTRRFGGSGLGLAICREVVKLMGGTIAAESQPQRGSTFTVRLPLPAIVPAHAPAAPLALRVAYIEPHEPSARALHALLLRMGCEPLPCRDEQDVAAAFAGRDALGRAPWLLVATDDAASLELIEQCAPHVDPERVIGMSSVEWYAADAAREGLRLARSVNKPVLRSALVSRFGAVADAQAGADSAGNAGPVDSAERAARVLVVEDDEVNQTIVASILAQAGFSVEVASDGVSALRSFDEMRFDLVLMDWQMPDMDGLEVTRRLRAGAAGARGRTTPIVALTANAFAEDRIACLAAGMNDFLTKPVVAEALVRTVNRWVGAAAH